MSHLGGLRWLGYRGAFASPSPPLRDGLVVSELLRVISISNTCDLFTKIAVDVALRLEEEKAEIVDKKLRKVSILSQSHVELDGVCSPGVSAVCEEASGGSGDDGQRLLHSQQLPGHLLPRNHLHLLGHPHTVHPAVIADPQPRESALSHS